MYFSFLENRLIFVVFRALKFRSYTPNDDKLREHVEIATPNDIGDTIESETKNLTKEALAQAAEKQKEEVVGFSSVYLLILLNNLIRI